MFVSVVVGSDRTTVFVATEHQEYHPVYMSPGNLTNIARQAHGNALIPVAFLPILKSRFHVHHILHLLTCSQPQKNTGKLRNTRNSHDNCITPV
jgi:hypothetical protein